MTKPILKMVVALLLGLWDAAAMAQQGDVFDSFFRFTGASPEASTGSAGTPADRLAGESIDPFTGNLRIERTDLELPGRGGLNLILQRTYSSKIWGRADLLDEEPLLAEKEKSVLGYGWSMHMGRLRGPNDRISPGAACGGSFPVFEGADGTSEVFYPATDGDGFLSRNYWRLRLNCSFASGGACIWTSSGIRYDIPGKYDDQFFMGTTPVWPVARIVDPSGNQITIEYVPQSGALNRIVDTYHRVVDFFYSSDVDGRRLDAFTVSDGRGNSKTYSYFYERRDTGAASFGHFALPGMRRFLIEALPPAGPSEYYTYGYSRTVDENQYALSEIVLPAGGRVSYTYQAVPFFTGREMVPFAVVKERTLAGPERGIPPGTWTYDYQSPGYKTYSATDPATLQKTDYHVTTVHRPDNKEDTYTIYGFGWVADQDRSGYTYLAGRVHEIARADRSEVEELWWDPRADAVIADVTYAAPTYSANCGSYYVYDLVVSAPVVYARAVTRDDAEYNTEVESFDPYGRPLLTKEWTNGQIGWVIDGRPLPSSFRYTSNTYFTGLDDGAGNPLNIVSGHPLSSVVTVGNDQTTTTWTYDRATGIKRTQTVDGVTTTFQPNAYGDPETVTDAAGHVLGIADYENGTPKTFDFNGAFRVTREVTWEGRVRVQRDGRGYPTTYDYDAAGRLKTVTPPGNSHPTTYDYAADGSWVRETRGAYWKEYDLDGLGRAVATLDSEGVRTSARFDAGGMRRFASSPYDDTISEVGTSTDFDGLGRPLQALVSFRPGMNACTTPSCRTEYDRQANCLTTVQEQDSSNVTRTTRCTWNFGNPEGGDLVQLLDPQGYLWDYRYDAAGKLRTVAAPLEKGARSYGYDTHGFLTSETSGEAGTTTYEPDAVGLVAAQTDARRLRVIFDRNDQLSRVKGIQYPRTSADDVTLGYDDANNLHSLESRRGGAFVYDHDELNRVYRQTWTRARDGVTRTYITNYHYDESGCLYEIDYPSGLVLHITCDSANRVKTISADSQIVVASVTYHPSGQPALVEYGNGTITSYDYDDRYRTKSVTVPGILGLKYGYDGVDNVTSREDTEAPGSAWTMTYDTSNRLRIVSGVADPVAVYTYDPLGNRDSKQGFNVTTKYVYGDLNRLDKTIGSEFLHSIKLTWDDAGRLQTSSDGATYWYDGQGRRVEKADSTEDTIYHYDSAGRVLAESRLDGTKVRDYVYLGGKLVAVSGCLADEAPPCTTWQWYHTDTLGSVSARTDATGALVARLQYEPWGEEWRYSGEPGDRQYNGRVYDPGTGFHDYGARMYWPQIGRFISADTYGGDIANPASLNRYSYVLNNPYKFVDPTGHQEAEPEERVGEARPEALDQLLLQGRLDNATQRIEAHGGSSASIRAPGPLTEAEVRTMEREADKVDPPPPLPTRRQALDQAQDHAQVPRESKGGEPIPFSELNGSSRGANAAELQRQGATNAGRRDPRTGASVEDHPDGHPGLTGPGQPQHHEGPHVHGTNAKGEEIVVPYGGPN